MPMPWWGTMILSVVVGFAAPLAIVLVGWGKIREQVDRLVRAGEEITKTVKEHGERIAVLHDRTVRLERQIETD